MGSRPYVAVGTLPKPGHFLADSAVSLAADYGANDRLRTPGGLDGPVEKSCSCCH